ncbi:sulfite reductase (NADPH) beta subunit [Salsuginibacillus halophilus]|uniref:Sulfite reductase [NADPH] hemoprotein beta-component n=1 Tax=Salsuginibacillus halophilus TaxID=517424 RepID=A0A2P8H9W0_9BACI|nr:assimilatory sulfite reductase (NADPH) hemoprotein subunit [Salsuginibacillus halophilus]PSL42959.1 sulfite reductase (NADPH) beta subunit [Salsuginibacillus halophilus]
MTDQYSKTHFGPPDQTEKIKQESNYLRGNLEADFANPITGAIPEAQTKILKFHGSYMQDDRDLRSERRQQKLEPAYQFMVRVRLAGGVATPEQWLTMDELARTYANETLKLTTRQTFQLHGILKWNMKPVMQEMNDALMDSIAACGDVNRNVMSTANPYQSNVHHEVYQASSALSDHLLPQTRAYHEIWLDEEKIVDSRDTEEPLYGPVYLPRKFKIGFAIPPTNDVDVFSQDIGFIAVVENEQLLGFNIAVGGGLGMTHGDTETYPQLGRVIGFCRPEDVNDVGEKILTIQRDYGNRSVRKNARFKYTVDRLGADVVLQELNERLGFSLEPARDYSFETNGDRYGWVKGDGKWHFNLYIPNGRVKDTEEAQSMTGLREIAKIHNGEFRLTPNQNVIIAGVSQRKKAEINKLLSFYGLTDGTHNSALRQSSMACVAFPTCGLAMAEAERYLPVLIDKLEDVIHEAGLNDEAINIRMTGCPNSCARPTLGEIGFIGKGPGKYNMYLGASHNGDRLNKLYRENIDETEILAELTPMLRNYAKERQPKEAFGDYVIRAGYVTATTSGTNFHD